MPPRCQAIVRQMTPVTAEGSGQAQYRQLPLRIGCQFETLVVEHLAARVAPLRFGSEHALDSAEIQ